MRWPSEMATEPTFRSDNPELCPGLIPSRLIVAIKVVRVRILQPLLCRAACYFPGLGGWFTIKN